MAKRICCPNILCKSTDVVPVSTKTKFSLRKAVIDGTVGSLFTPLEQLLAQQAALTESMEKRNLYAKIAGKCLRKSLNSGGNTFMEILAKKFEEELIDSLGKKPRIARGLSHTIKSCNKDETENAPG